MIQPVLVSAAGRERRLSRWRLPLDPAALLGAGDGDGDTAPAGEEGRTGAGGRWWEIEIGFGKGRYLLAQAKAHPERRYLGIEVVTKYYRLLARRAARAGITNLAVLRGEALYLLSAVLPAGFAQAVHVYFPDPWPKSRHHKRRLFDPQTVDLVVGLLAPGGTLSFATDYLSYGERVARLLAGYPGLAVERREATWADGARTNYEAKYQAEGRPIVRLVARRRPAAEEQPAPAVAMQSPAGAACLHPAGAAGVVAAVSPRPATGAGTGAGEGA